jgi:hypothetical protein
MMLREGREEEGEEQGPWGRSTRIYFEGIRRWVIIKTGFDATPRLP